MLGGGIDIVIVGGEAGLLELAGLNVSELAEGHADFHAKLGHFAHGFDHGFKFRVAIAHALPCGSHAEARGAIRPGALGHRKYLCGAHEGFFLEARIVVGALSAVAAILAAAASLHAEQGAELDFVFRPEFEKYPAAFLNQVEEWAVVNFFEGFQRLFHDARF